jgi:hypothetical protein
VGAGLSGLAAAAELAVDRPVTLVERLPAVGGGWGFEHPEVRRLAESCRAHGVEFHLGVCALRWDGARLLLVGPGIMRWLPADRLVFAGGTRPATAAELGIAGGRLAGVFPATVAHHLLDAGIVLGRRTVVLGTGDWADLVVPHLGSHGRVTVIGGTAADEPPPPGIRWLPDYRPLRIRGMDRVNEVVVGNGRAEQVIGCDSVVLAGSPRPLRNVDGAIRDDAAGVRFVQSIAAGMNAEDVVQFARAAVAAQLNLEKVQ